MSRPASVSIRTADLRRLAHGWLLDCQYRNLSPCTLELRRSAVEKFLWWLEREEIASCGLLEVKGFMAYLRTGHQDPEGRFGNPALRQPLSARSLKDWHVNLSTLFRFLASEGYVEGSPMEGLKPPIHRPDQVQPFTEEQVQALLRTARKTRYPKRDEAILLFLLDTGVRASELCGLKLADVDIVSRKAVVLGKGNKHRAIFFGRETGRVLWQYVKPRQAEPWEPLFASERGVAFTRSGLQQLIERLGKEAGLQSVRNSPHTFRHTCAVLFLRSGGSVFALKEMLGHTTLDVTKRYVALAQADVQNQHRQFSPVEHLRGGRMSRASMRREEAAR